MRATRVLALVLVLGLVMAGCGGGEKKKAAVPVYTVKASEPSAGKFAFDLPADMKAGVITLQLQNAGKESHDLQLATVVEGHTLDELLKQIAADDAPLEPWIEAAGGVGFQAPGATGQATVRLNPGKYWYFCTESTEEEGKPPLPHATNGMSGELTLSGDSGAELPRASASLVASEYTFTTTGFKAGTNIVSFRNDGKQLHHALLAPMAAGATIDDVKAALASETEPTGPPPIDFDKAVATAVINPGQTIVLSFDLAAGSSYAVLCFLPDKGTAGPPHTAKGMVVELKIA